MKVDISLTSPTAKLLFSVGIPAEGGGFVQDHAQQGIVDFETAIVLDKSEFAEFPRLMRYVHGSSNAAKR